MDIHIIYLTITDAAYVHLAVLKQREALGEQNVCVCAGGARVNEGAVWQQAGDIWSGAGEDSAHGSPSVCHRGIYCVLLREVSFTRVSIN